MSVAEVILFAVAAYSAVGALFGVAFVTLGVGRVDRAARGAPWSFRMLIWPGAAALWPVVLAMWVRAARSAPSEFTP